MTYPEYQTRLQAFKVQAEAQDILPEQKLYQPYFNIVADKYHWKNPIHIILPSEIPVAEMILINRAIRFYTGADGMITQVGNADWTVRAAGYYKTCGA